jgi:hypothetical protein
MIQRDDDVNDDAIIIEIMSYEIFSTIFSSQ